MMMKIYYVASVCYICLAFSTYIHLDPLANVTGQFAY